MPFALSRLSGVLLLCAAFAAGAQTAQVAMPVTPVTPATPATPATVAGKDNIAGPYVSTPWPVVDELLKLADFGKDDLVYDPGSGDGRLVITAARRFGARGVGLEIAPGLIARANAQAQSRWLASRSENKRRQPHRHQFRLLPRDTCHAA